MLYSIIIAGDNSGLVSIYQAMKDYARKIFIFTNTAQVINKRAEDVFINDFFEVEENLVLCSAYAPLIPKEDLQKKTFLNIHYALLPRFRGMHPVVWAILNDEKELGFSLHEIDEFMDSGPVIYQYKIANDYESTSIFYMEHFHKKVVEQIGPVVLSYQLGKIKAVAQDHSQAAWGAKRNLNDCKLDFNFTNQQIRNFFRALVRPYPLPFIEYKNKKYFIEQYKIHEQNIAVLTLGRIVNIDNWGIWVKIKEGYLNIQCLTDESGNKVNMKEIFKIGSRLDV